MKPTPRKSPHFFIINPIKDRRIETRFDAQEPVQIRLEDSGEVAAGIANDIGQYGLKLAAARSFEVGDRIQIVFTGNIENIGCFGRIAWSRPAEEGKGFESGLAIDSWHGIVEGPQSWKKIKGVLPIRDRRRKER